MCCHRETHVGGLPSLVGLVLAAGSPISSPLRACGDKASSRLPRWRNSIEAVLRVPRFQPGKRIELDFVLPQGNCTSIRNAFLFESLSLSAMAAPPATAVLIVYNSEM